jgi:WD40 repeat protein
LYVIRFHIADTDNRGELDEQNFIALFSKLLSNASKRSIKALFRKIDANANGYVSFDEFSSYILFRKGEENMTNEDNRMYTSQSFTDSNKQRQLHSDYINAIDMDEERNIYYTSGNDGTVRAWNASDLTHINTFHISPPRSFIYDIHFEKVERELYVAGLDRAISVYNEKQQLVRIYKGKVIHRNDFKPEKYVYNFPPHMKEDYNRTERSKSISFFTTLEIN